MPNLGTSPLGETMLIRLLVRFAAEPHSPVEMSDGSKGASAVVALVRDHLHVVSAILAAVRLKKGQAV